MGRVRRPDRTTCPSACRGSSPHASQLGQRAAQTTIAEVGLDMTRFPTAEHLASCAKLCPRRSSPVPLAVAVRPAKATLISKVRSARPPPQRLERHRQQLPFAAQSTHIDCTTSIPNNLTMPPRYRPIYRHQAMTGVLCTCRDSPCRTLRCPPATATPSTSRPSPNGRTVIYLYPLTGRPGIDLSAGWDSIRGARGCSTEACNFRDHHQELRDAGAADIYGMSRQWVKYQAEVVERLHLPFRMLSDPHLALADALDLPASAAPGHHRLYSRRTLIVTNGAIEPV